MKLLQSEREEFEQYKLAEVDKIDSYRDEEMKKLK